MVTGKSTDPGSCIDAKDPFELPPEAHDLVEIERETVLNISNCECFEITRECRDCGQTTVMMRADGEIPDSNDGLIRALYELYESFYEDPRGIQHIHLIHISPGEDRGTKIGLAEYLAAAVDLGADDALNDRDKRGPEAVLSWALPET